MFTHLHLHTEYSLLDGACRIEPLILKAKELGQTSVAITDHGVMYGAVDFYKCAKKHGIKPIIGCEVYVAARTMNDTDKVLDRYSSHLVLLCKNEQGYKNLIKMVSDAFTKGFYSRPRVDHELIEKHSEGLVCLSACLSGEIPKAILADDFEKALSIAKWYDGVFGRGNYYLELQDHGLTEQKKVNDALLRIHDMTGIPLVATNDVHYLEKQDSIVQQLLICIQTNHVLGEDTGLEFHSKEFYLKSEDEMRSAFAFCPQAIENTQLIAEMCNFDFEFGNTKLPYFEIETDETHFEYFKRKCFEGLKKRYGENVPDEYVRRLEYELETVDKMGYTDYYLIVADFINYAKKQNIPVGPGRGSGVGSIAAYCIGITNVDPMKYNLLFERFLNPERVSMPDFDVDFCYERRPEVIDYVIRKYGADHVAQIVTFGTLAARAAIRDCGRAMGLPYAQVDSVAKLVPNRPGMTLEKAFAQSPDLRTLYETNQQVKTLLDFVRKVEGMPRNASTHAAGVVITRDPVNTYVPLSRNDDLVVTQYVMTSLEELGLLKMDFLGLRTLTVIDDAQKAVNKYNPQFDIQKIPLDDKKVLELFCKGNTDGIFQFESAGMKRMLTELKPESLEDLIAATSLYRPGPANQINTYVVNRHNTDKIKYVTPKLSKILDVTYGCMVYQEQVMQIFRELANYSYGHADIVRRAMAKKKQDVMQKERVGFIEGCAENGISQDIANSIFDEIAEFAKYAFNKSHAAAYAYVAYQTAYLKVYYPCEFMASLLTSVLDSFNKVALYISESKRLGLSLSTPNINTSFKGFTANGKVITYGLLGIKNVGSDFIDKIINERQTNGYFTDLYDFCYRLKGRDFNKRAVESLIKCGAMDCFEQNRRQMLQALPTITAQIESERRLNVEGQLGFFELTNDASASSFAYPVLDEFPNSQLLKMEKEMTGLYLSGHPVEKYSAFAASSKFAQIGDLISEENTQYSDKQNVRVLGIITDVVEKEVKRGGIMAFATIEDVTGSVETIIFPKILAAYSSFVSPGNIVVVDAVLSIEEEKGAKLIVNSVHDASRAFSEAQKRSHESSTAQTQAASKKKRHGLFVRFSSADDERIERVKSILSQHKGTVPLAFYYLDEKRYDFFPENRNVYVDDEIIGKISTFMGQENVVFVK